MATQEQEENLGAGRQRRSAATKNKAWASLVSSSKHKGDEIDEEEDPSVPPPRSTPKSAPRSVPRKKAKTEASPEPPKLKSPESKSSPTPQQAPRLFPSISVPQTVKMGSISNGAKSGGAAAFGKDQIDSIEKEMFKTYMSNESDEFSDNDSMEAEESMMGLLDEDDEDYLAKPKRNYTKRASTSSKAKPRGILKNPPFNPRSGGLSQFHVQNVVSRSETIQRVVPRPIPTLKYASSNLVGANENRPLKMVLLRPPVKSTVDNKIYGNGDGPRMPMTISSMSVQSSKEIEEIKKKFGDRVVPGSTVQKFNDLVDTLVGELKSMAEDRERLIRNHRELTEQMTLSHSTALDIKDSRIQQLENYVDKLQTKIVDMSTKLQSSFSQHESEEKSIINDENDEDDEEE